MREGWEGTQGVFPAHAGMSPRPWPNSKQALGFPRSRGDEPRTVPLAVLDAQFSPLTRG